MQQSTKVIFIYILFLALLFGVLTRYIYVAFADREIARVTIKDREKAKRGSIISSDEYQIAYTTKVYTASVDTRDIPKDNENIFAQMFSIYSNIPKEKILKKIRAKSGNVMLSKNLSFQQYQGIKELSQEFTALKILVGRNTSKGSYQYVGLSVKESGAERQYPYGDTLTPFIGYTNSFIENKYNRVVGIKGLERRFEEDIKPSSDGYIRGNRDIRGNMILNRNLDKKMREDGADIHLNINISVQKKIEMLLSEKKEEFKAKQIIASVMESSTGNIVAIATSNRFVRKHLSDISYLNVDAVEYVFEPGSVMKPIIYSLLLNEKKIRRGQHIDCENGRYKVGRKIITDEHPMKLIPVEDILIHSSNIGMAKLVKNVDATDFYNGLKKFGFGQRTGLEVSREIRGRISSIKDLNRHIYRATASYGYGITVNFVQLLKAFNVFNNDGRMLNPKAVSYLKAGEKIYSDIERTSLIENGAKILEPLASRKMKNILIRTVKSGTGKSANVLGLEIGGKTGTAHIAENGGYSHKYHSSFFGFVNDKSHKYTIGVTVIEPKKLYFASQTAGPIFKSIVNILVDEKFLKKF